MKQIPSIKTLIRSLDKKQALLAEKKKRLRNTFTQTERSKLNKAIKRLKSAISEKEEKLDEIIAARQLSLFDENKLQK